MAEDALPGCHERRYPALVAEPIPVELIDAVRNEDAVLFCGAGLSVSQGLPTAGALAQSIAARMQDFDGDPRNLTQVATAYAALRGRHALISFVVESLMRQPWRPGPAHADFAGLPFHAFVTTNWDTLVEGALRAAQRRHQVVITDSDIPFLTRAAVPVVKIHGELARPETLVITDRDYFDLFSLRLSLTRLLDHYFSTKTLVFVGFALADPDFKQLFHACTQRFGPLRRHAYAIQLGPAAADRHIWQAEQVDVIDADARDFAADLVHAVALPQSSGPA